MSQFSRRVVFAVSLAALALSACKGSSDPLTPPLDARRDGPAGDGGPPGDTRRPDTRQPVIAVEPVNPQLVVEPGQPLPSVKFSATLDGAPVVPSWSLDVGELGTITAEGLFTPSGTVGGPAQVTAAVGGATGATTVKVLLKMSQNGSTQGNGNPGPGGFGGVGGEGLGGAVPPSVLTVLGGPATPAPGLRLLYPYDQTVWPLGILAPLLQWNAPPQGTGDAVLLELSSPGFEFKGSFGRPAALPAGAPFLRHPIPQDIWKAATRSTAGGPLVVKVTVASGGVAYGPLTQTWIVARGGLRGTVYYQSYGTNLAKNLGGAVGGDGKFGGATLAIRGGSTDPTLVAGKSGGKAECRVCHAVSADGSRMVVQHGDDYDRSSSYDLQNGYLETAYAPSTTGQLGWIGLSPDGKVGLGNLAPMPGINSTTTALYDMTNGLVFQNTPGLSTFVSAAGFPTFAPDGKRVAFAFLAGAGNAAIGPGDGKKLVVMDFDPAQKSFANPRLVYQGAVGSRPGWPAFWPTGGALLFQVELPGNTSSEYFATRNGGRGELRWVDLASATVAALHGLNGKDATGVSYLPTGTANHGDDTALAYEPTVSPIASGGYAWVVFTSRRLYGNVATIDPWWSDPREHDLTATPTTKKLWVAALDLNPKPGADPSHPPFYLPAQELMAGNTRGFWVADPCKANGQPCAGGDECCGGFCTQSGAAGALICGTVSSGCAKEFDKCQQSADCCNHPTFQCVNGYCTRWTID